MAQADPALQALLKVLTRRLNKMNETLVSTPANLEDFKVYTHKGYEHILKALTPNVSIPLKQKLDPLMTQIDQAVDDVAG